MQTNSVETKKANNINGKIYSEQEKALLNNIITNNNTVAENTYKVGECCHSLVKLNGGIQYKDKTIEKILKYPGMNCCRDHLVDCWNYYRFVNNEAYQSKSLDKLKNEKPSALYQICKIANSKLEQGVKTALIKEVIEAADREDQAVRQVEAVVNAILKDKGQMRKSRAKCPITKQKIQQIVGSFKTVAESEEQFKWFMSNKENRQGIAGILEELTNYVEKIPEYGKDKMINDKIKMSAKRLNIVAGKM